MQSWDVQSWEADNRLCQKRARVESRQGGPLSSAPSPTQDGVGGGRPDLWGDVVAEAAGALTPRGHGDEVQALLLARSPRRWHGSVEQPRLPEKHLARGQNDLRVRVGPLQVKASGPPGRARASPITLPLSPGLASPPETGWRGPACPLCRGARVGGAAGVHAGHSVQKHPSRFPLTSASPDASPGFPAAPPSRCRPGDDSSHPATGYAHIEAAGTWKASVLPWSGTRDRTGWGGLGSGLDWQPQEWVRGQEGLCKWG